MKWTATMIRCDNPTQKEFMHRYRWAWKHGFVQKIIHTGRSTKIPSLEDVKKKIVVDPKTGCWEWQGTRCAAGYAKMAFMKKKEHLVSHWMVEKVKREKIPDGFVVCHHCDNPPCVNPDHLFCWYSGRKFT